MDKDSSGRIDKDEFNDFFTSLDDMPVDDSQIEGLFNAFDKSGDGIISVEEFAQGMRKCVEFYQEGKHSCDHYQGDYANEDYNWDIFKRILKN